MAQRIKNLLLEKLEKLRGKGADASAAEIKYSLLSPVLLEDQEIARYSDEFELALTHQDAKNIALSGPYGAGKSSVAMTLETRELCLNQR